VGSYQFSRDQSEREKQMEFFHEIEKEVNMPKRVISFNYRLIPMFYSYKIESSKLYTELYKLKREKALLERLSKVKQRRLLKHGFTADEIKSYFCLIYFF